MTRRSPRQLPLRSPWLVAGAAASLLLGVAGMAATAQAQPAPAPRADDLPAAFTEPVAPPAPAAGSFARVRLAPSFLADLERSRATIVGLGDTRVGSGGTLEFPVATVLGDGFGLGGGFAITVDGVATFSCEELSVSLPAQSIFCRTGEMSRRLLVVGEAEKTSTENRWITHTNMRLTIAGERRAAQLNGGLKGAPLAAGDVVGEMDLTTKRLLRGDSPRDDRTGCEIGDYASDNSIWRGWAIQALINRLPKDVGMSQYVYDEATKKGTVSGGDSPAVTVGQRTPYMEGITTAQSKRIVRGSYYNTDNFWGGPAYKCNTNAPFVVGQGLLDAPDVRTWRYDGGLRNKTDNDAGPARPQWWGHGRQTNYDGATGNYSWTCRGLPANRTSTAAQPNGDTRWDKVSNGADGFFGDTATDRTQPNAGRAPGCRDLNLEGFTFTTRYSISKRGALQGRDERDDYPRYCTVTDNPLVSCWQEIYPLWDRAWAFQNHVYASAMRAEITSNATINIPAAWSPTGVATLRPIAWRITNGDIGAGAWPHFRAASGTELDFSGIEQKFSAQDMSKVSPFTVPGTNVPFTVSGYGTPMGPQEMSFILTADTDGSWTWPVDGKTGRELPRPQIKMTFNYVISNYDDGGSCPSKLWYDDGGFGNGRDNDSAGAHCLEGNVPTLWPLPENKSDYWKRVPDAFVTDKDGKKVRNTPNVSFAFTPLTSCLQDKELTVQDNSTKNVPAVGADFMWDIRISGQVKSFSGC